MNNLDKLHKLGQSPWYDNISRDLLDSGEIRRLVQSGIRGMTSNPAIFKSAITSGEAYDNQLRSLIRPGVPAAEIFEALAVDDIRDACDILRPIFDSSHHVDGFVSLEVSPLLAADTESTVAEAERLRPMVDRPNLFIKIPATVEGIPAIEECLYRGYSINITLIFSRAMYERVMEAYLSALERRAADGNDIREVRSVASFFVSRVDTLVDKKLEKLAAESDNADDIRALMGKAGIANAKLAYQDYKRVFESERFQKLAEQGALVQRPLWASTSTKNPAYPSTLYVDNLIGPDTVNTMPAETVTAFVKEGTPALTIEEGIDEAQMHIAALERVGISMDVVTQELLDEGVQKFAEPYEALLAAIDEKVNQMAAAD